jgi:ABC-type multidrug transport system ATPase subunit
MAEGPPYIRRVEIDNFKSLVGFALDLDRFTCLIGLNGSGKSTVLQAIDFLARLFHGKLAEWLSQRQWTAADLSSKLIRRSNVHFSLRAVAKTGSEFCWQGTFNRALLRCTQESLLQDGTEWIRVEDGHYFLNDDSAGAGRAPARTGVKISFDYQGSILSQLTSEALPPVVLGFKSFVVRTKSLDLLAPQYLRQRTRDSGGGLGLSGERLSAFLHELPRDKRLTLEEQLRRCYPSLSNIHTSSLRSGWKQLEVEEVFGDRKLLSEARHVNDGMLRLIAILSEILTDDRFLLFDEIENGINSELVEFLLGILVNARQQVLVTTHSPMILNYLDDDVARRGVQYLYKTPEGYTRSVPFFSIPSVSEKLEVMGPGEAFVDTNLTRLQEEIQAMTAAAQG